MVESMREVFAGHPDKLLAKTKVSIEYPQDKNLYPSVIVRFFVGFDLVVGFEVE